MFTFKPIKLRIGNERLLSCKQYVKLFETSRQSIISAKFVLPKPGSRTVGAYVQVKLRPQQRITLEQYNKALEKAERQIEKGNFIRQEELEKEMEKW